METLVHLNPPLAFRYIVFRVEFDEELVEKMVPAGLSADWFDEPPPSAQAVGDLWVGQAHSAVLESPGAVIQGEANFLLNPAHPDFKRIDIGVPESFAFDSRLL